MSTLASSPSLPPPLGGGGAQTPSPPVARVGEGSVAPRRSPPQANAEAPPEDFAAGDEDHFNPEVVPMLRTIGRGAHGSRGLSVEQARTLMGWLLRRELSDAQMGGVLLALRMKGESAEELEGFTRAVRASLPAITPGRPVVVLPSVNGARRLPNQVPLLALLLRQRGIPVLVLGTEQSDGRLHTARIWAALGLHLAGSSMQAQALLDAGEAVYLDLGRISPQLAALLQWRSVLGVRNAGHSVVKLLAPVAGPSLLLASYTHPEYAVLMRDVLQRLGQPALLMRGCEGEAVAHPSRAGELLHIDAAGGLHTELATEATQAEVALPPCGTDLAATLGWIADVRAGRKPVPTPLARQADSIAAALRAAQAGGSGGESGDGPEARPAPILGISSTLAGAGESQPTAARTEAGHAGFFAAESLLHA
ncbi:MAG: DNA-binding protein YbiB [Thiomonas sp.]